MDREDLVVTITVEGKYLSRIRWFWETFPIVWPRYYCEVMPKSWNAVTVLIPSDHHSNLAQG